jgi:hypothetical protein
VKKHAHSPHDTAPDADSSPTVFVREAALTHK